MSPLRKGAENKTKKTTTKKKKGCRKSTCLRPMSYHGAKQALEPTARPQVHLLVCTCPESCMKTDHQLAP